MSVIAIVGRCVLLLLHGPLDKAWIAVPRPEAKAIFDGWSPRWSR
jgi:multicomponent K+:H+ antiporter subunit A